MTPQLSSKGQIAVFAKLVLQLVGTLALILAVAVAVMLVVLPGWLQNQDEPTKSDYLVVLAGDNHRLLKASELYRAGYAPKLLLSNERERPLSRIEILTNELGFPLPPKRRVVRELIFQHAGVPSDAVQEFGNALVSTLEEAEALKALLGNRTFKAIIVTSAFHAKRAKITFESVMPQAHFLVLSPPERTIAQRWWSDPDSALLVMSETAKLLHFWLGSPFRGEAQLTHPASIK